MGMMRTASIVEKISPHKYFAGWFFKDHPAVCLNQVILKRLNVHQAGEKLVTNETPQV